MNRLFSFYCLIILLPLGVFAQEKELTIGDATGMNTKLNAANLSQLQWLPGTHEYVYVAKNCLVRGDVSKPRTDTLVRLQDLNLILKFNKLDTLKRFPSVTFRSAVEFYYSNNSRLVNCHIMNNTVTAVNSWPGKAENLDIESTRELVAYTKDNNLYISAGGQETAVSDEKNPGILYGSSRVHRNEFGITRGTFWSPKGNFLAFYRMDETMVADYPLVDITTRIATVTPEKYPMAGMTSHKVTLGVYSLAEKSIIYLKTDSTGISDPAKKVEYLTCVTWSPDEKYIYIACLNRDQNFMQLNMFDASTGRFVKTLFEEKNDAYVEPLHSLAFLKNDPGKFIWQSRRDGFNHLYLYTGEGNLVSQITRGPWEVTQLPETFEAGNRVYFMCNKDKPIDNLLYSADIKKGTIARLTGVSGTHSAQVSDDGKFILDTYTNDTTPRRIEVLDPSGKPVRTLLSAENPLKDYTLGTTSVFTIRNDSTDLYCRLIKPARFNPEKKYPVIIYVYGGPHSQLVTNSWLGGGGLFLNYLAAQGYVVFTLDNRGTSNRGLAFEQAIFRNLGEKEVSDQMAGVSFLKSLPFVDTTRIGINGWSYGGFMTISMFLRSPGTFKVAVCGGPVIDWKYYEVMYGERYMDTPESNPDGYRNASLLNRVKDLKGKLLIIHDDQDNTVVPQNSISFLKKCVDEGKQVDFFLYPGHEHNVRGKDRVHLNTKMVRYFQDYL